MTQGVENFPDMAEAAAQWVIRRDRGLSTLERAELAAWLAAHPKHAEEYTRIASSWQSLDRLSPAHVLSAAADAVVSRAQVRQSRHRFTVMARGLLATAAALAVGYFVWPGSAPADNYQVIASTSREVRLPDGSTAILNGDGLIETHYTANERRIRLVHGEALFTVAKNPDRPFYVTAGPITVRAVGTAFNVRMGATAVEVLVTEGKVKVNDNLKGNSLVPPASGEEHAPEAPAPEGVLVAGQRLTVNLAAVVDHSIQAQVAAVAPHEMESSLAWMSTQLVFNDTSLDDVVAAFNRYNQHKLAIGDSALNTRQITGVFRADNLEGFTRLLEAGLDVRTESRGDRETILAPRP